MSNETADIARRWVLLHSMDPESDDHDAAFDVYIELDDVCRGDAQRCWKIIESIFETDRSDRVLSNLAAGPLEDLLVRHGDIVVAQVVEKASSSEEFRRVLGAVWRNDIPEHIWRKIEPVRGETW